MKKVLSTITTVILVMLFTNVMAQELAMPSYSYSEKKTAYFTMNDGSKVEARVVKLSRKKGQIDELKLKGADGKKVKLTPVDISSMYLPESAYNKLLKLDKFMSDASLWKSDNLDNEKIADGYVYFESTDVKMGKKTRKLMMQVLNPAFSSKVKIYNDPFAKETASVGIGGIALAGGDAKSYYFKKGEGTATYLTKKEYKKQFKEIWSDCPALIEKYGESPKWTDLAKHIFEYTEECK